MKTLFASTAIGCCLVFPAGMALAQSAPPAPAPAPATAPASTTAANPAGSSAVLGEIVVTAQKRAQSVSEIPISMTAIGGQDLRRQQISDVSSVATQLPNVVATTSVNLPAFTIRGIGLNNFASNFDSPVAIHVDEIYKSKPYMATVPFYDISRVEALKGPQGTLFGRNTTGGSVNFYTNEPEFRNGGGINLTGDNFGRYHLDGFFNVAVSDDFALRASYYIAEGTGGPYHNLFTGQSYGIPNQNAGRLQAKWKNDDTTVRFTVYGFKDKSQLTPYKSPGVFSASGAYCPQLLSGKIDDDRAACLKWPGGVTAGTNMNNPSGLRETQSITDLNANYLWTADNTAYGTSLRIEHKFGDATLTAISSYDYFERVQTENADDTPYQTDNMHFYSQIKQFTQEIRFGGKTGNLNYLIGGFYENDNIHEVNSALELGNTAVGLPDIAPRFATQFAQGLQSLAVFTHNEYEVLPGVSIVAGLRYSSDRTSLNGSTFLGANDPVGLTQAVTEVIPVDALVATRTDNNLSFRGGVDWHVAPDNLLYVSVSRGYRAGGYSIPFGAIITTFAPEQLTSYEGGYKARFFGRTLDVNAAVFYYDYLNLQETVNDPSSPVVPITRNVGAARTYGAEGDITWRPTSTLVGRVGFSYLDAQVSSSDRTVSSFNGPIPLQGRRLINSPPWTVQAFLQKTFPINDTFSLVAQTDAKYVDGRYLVASNQPYDFAPQYWTQNARLSLVNTQSGWEVAIWGKNLWNAAYLTYLNNLPFNRLEIYGEPASGGVAISYKF